MKIQPNHYKLLSDAMGEALVSRPDMYQSYQDAGLSGMRYRWDLLRASRIENVGGISWICDTLYKYLNDDHIDTALRRITNTH